MGVTLLGPQRFEPTVGQVVEGLGLDGGIATVNAGWQEREPDDAELDRLLGGRSVNLSLYARWHDVMARDPDLAAADQRRRDVLDELQSVYGLRLHHAMQALSELRRWVGDPQVHAAAQADGLDAVRELDARHLARVAEVNAEYYERVAPHDRPAVAEHRSDVARAVEGTAAVAIAGGHVGVLLDCLHLFNVAAGLAGSAVVAWSAGAMAVTDRVVVFHDHAPDGRAYSEVYAHGLGLCPDVVAFPHARRRLRTDDEARMALLRARFAPAECLLLEDGTVSECDGKLAA